MEMISKPRCIFASVPVQYLSYLLISHTTLGTMTTAELVGLIAVTIEFVVGIALNMHILLIYIGHLRNGLSLGSSDKVLVSKALVNVSLHLTMTSQNIIIVLWPHLFFSYEGFRWTVMISICLITYSYWLTSLLCVYYCTNITNFGHHIFVWLKRSLSSYLLHIILVSGLVSLVISCPVFWFCNINPTMNITHQSSVIRGTFFQNFAYRITLAILGSFLPFAIALVSTAFTARSLINHMWTMKQNNRGFARSKFQTQINAARTMVLFLLIAVIYNVSQMLFFTIPSSVSDSVVIVNWFVMISYPASEAIIIIQSSSKFRKTIGKCIVGKLRNHESDI